MKVTTDFSEQLWLVGPIRPHANHFLPFWYHNGSLSEGPCFPLGSGLSGALSSDPTLLPAHTLAVGCCAQIFFLKSSSGTAFARPATIAAPAAGMARNKLLLLIGTIMISSSTGTSMRFAEARTA